MNMIAIKNGQRTVWYGEFFLQIYNITEWFIARLLIVNFYLLSACLDV